MIIKPSVSRVDLRWCHTITWSGVKSNSTKTPEYLQLSALVRDNAHRASCNCWWDDAHGTYLVYEMHIGNWKTNRLEKPHCTYLRYIKIKMLTALAPRHPHLHSRVIFVSFCQLEQEVSRMNASFPLSLSSIQWYSKTNFIRQFQPWLFVFYISLK